MKLPFIWDKYSNQPFPIADKKYKSHMKKKYLFSMILMFAKSLIFFPLGIALMKLSKGKVKIDKKFYSMGVELDKGIVQKELIDELGIKSVLIRLPLWEMHRINEYLEFVRVFTDDGIEVLLNILQDRENIENEYLLNFNISIIFKLFSPYVSLYQIGNAINRSKWGFFSIHEYLEWYKKIQEIRNLNYLEIELIGPSVIDFEYHCTIDALFNFKKIKFDGLSSLLYVDRRGDPDNKQMFIFDTKNKISMLYTLAKLSMKTKNKIYITEANWPLQGTAPYAPTSEKECISEHEYAKYMVKYLETAKQSRKIERVYWHQLIAPGYGLVDNRNGKIRKMKAFGDLKSLIEKL